MSLLTNFRRLATSRTVRCTITSLCSAERIEVPRCIAAAKRCKLLLFYLDAISCQ